MSLPFFSHPQQLNFFFFLTLTLTLTLTLIRKKKNKILNSKTDWRDGGRESEINFPQLNQLISSVRQRFINYGRNGDSGKRVSLDLSDMEVIVKKKTKILNAKTE